MRRRNVPGPRSKSNRFLLAYERLRWFITHRLLHADDSPQRIARGVALGLFIAITPTFGIQLVSYFPIAYLCRANRAAGFPFLWITNALTLVPIYGACAYVGAKLLGAEPVSLTEMAQDHGSWWDAVQYFWNLSLEFAGQLWLGCGLVGLVTAAIGYFATQWIVTHYRMRKWGSVIVPADHVMPPPRKGSDR